MEMLETGDVEKIKDEEMNQKSLTKQSLQIEIVYAHALPCRE